MEWAGYWYKSRQSPKSIGKNGCGVCFLLSESTDGAASQYMKEKSEPAGINPGEEERESMESSWT